MLRIYRSISVLVIASIWFALIPPDTQASCGSANCFLVTGTQEGIAMPGQIILDLSYRFIPMDRVHKGSENASEALVPKIDFENGEIELNHHREIRTNNELAQLDVSYGVTPRFALTLAIPFLNNRLHEHFDEVGEPEEFFTRQDGTSGFGDIRLIGKYALWVNTRHLFVGGLGVKTPTGEYKLRDSEGNINEPTIMPGTGSWDGIVSVYYAYQVIPHRFDVFLSSSYQIATENNLDYKFGNTLLINGGGNYLFGEKVTASLQLNFRLAPHDEFRNHEVPSTGGKWVYITPGIKAQASSSTAFYAHVQIPVYQFVNEENLVPRYGLIFGVSYAF